MNDTYLYPYSSAEARDRKELPLWRESHKANIACRNAIEDAIRQSFDGMHLDKNCITLNGNSNTAFWKLECDFTVGFING